MLEGWLVEKNNGMDDWTSFPFILLTRAELNISFWFWSVITWLWSEESWEQVFDLCSTDDLEVFISIVKVICGNRKC